MRGAWEGVYLLDCRLASHPVGGRGVNVVFLRYSGGKEKRTE